MAQGKDGAGRTPPVLALRGAEEAAAALGISGDTFDRYVRGHVRGVRLGTLTLYPVAALEAFLEANAVSPADEVLRRRKAGG